MFTNILDGLKNYFTFTQFIAQESSELGPWHFTQMNYPFGEYVFFTDNTPFLAMPLRWINLNIINIEAYSIGIHNYFFLLNVFITPILFFILLRPYAKKSIGLLILLSIGVSWINPQLLKLVYGTYNLSLSFLLLLALLLLQRIHQRWDSFTIKVDWKILVSVFLLIFISASIHIYYIPLLALPIGVFTFVLFCFSLIQDKKFKLLPLLTIVGVALFAGIGYYFLIQGIDTYADLRRATASGFDWSEWNFTPEAVMTEFHFNTLRPIAKSCYAPGELSNESHGFWGNFVWYSIYAYLILGVVFILLKRLSLKRLVKRVVKNRLWIAMFFTTIITYATAAGTYVKLCAIPLGFDNIISPFYFLHDKIDLITQFRCLARFSWMGFWMVLLVFSVLFIRVINWLKIEKKGLSNALLAFLFFILFFDVKDGLAYQQTVFSDNIFERELLQNKFDAIEEIEFDDYQAIYTIPAVQVGSEDYDITIDDQAEWTSYWMQLSAYSKLPLFNCKMSRTAVEQAKAQVDLLIDREVPDLIQKKVNEQPVLVIYSKEMEESFDLKIRDYALPAIENGSEIITSFKMDTILEVNGIYYLSWDIENNN